MSQLKHVWFDVDNTLYPLPPEMEAEIFKRMYERVYELTRLKEKDELEKTGKKDVHNAYNAAYEFKESHSDAFKRLGFPVDASREIYGSVKLVNYWKLADKKPVPDKKLLALLDHLDRAELPYSFYTNNFLDAVLETFDVLGVDFKRFARHITGDSHNKALGTKGYERVIELSLLEEEKRKGPRIDTFGPHKILYVGDREDIDIIPAHSKGMQTALVVWPDGKDDAERARQMDEVKTVADFKLPDVYSLAEVVDRLTRQ